MHFSRVGLAAIACLTSACSDMESLGWVNQPEASGFMLTSNGSAKAKKGAANSISPTSRILGKRNVMTNGQAACEISFNYARRPIETVTWKEPCNDVTARFLSQAELTQQGDWDVLGNLRDAASRSPGGKVFYVEGNFSASVYILGNQGKSLEIPVSD